VWKKKQDRERAKTPAKSAPSKQIILKQGDLRGGIDMPENNASCSAKGGLGALK